MVDASLPVGEYFRGGELPPGKLTLILRAVEMQGNASLESLREVSGHPWLKNSCPNVSLLISPFEYQAANVRIPHCPSGSESDTGDLVSSSTLSAPLLDPFVESAELAKEIEVLEALFTQQRAQEQKMHELRENRQLTVAGVRVARQASNDIAHSRALARDRPRHTGSLEYAGGGCEEPDNPYRYEMSHLVWQAPLWRSGKGVWAYVRASGGRSKTMLTGSLECSAASDSGEGSSGATQTAKG